MNITIAISSYEDYFLPVQLLHKIAEAPTNGDREVYTMGRLLIVFEEMFGASKYSELLRSFSESDQDVITRDRDRAEEYLRISRVQVDEVAIPDRGQEVLRQA